MLFTFPSQYWFAIGLSGVFSLTGWSPRIHTGFLVSRTTQVPPRLRFGFVYGIVTFSDPTFQLVRLPPLLPLSAVLLPRSCRNRNGLGYSAFARHYWRNHCYFLFLWVMRCFSSPRLPTALQCVAFRRRVAPFGDLRVSGYLLLTAAFRSLSRPSSPSRA